jgi:hypothetical protein
LIFGSPISVAGSPIALYVSFYSTERKDTSYNNIETPGSARKPSTAGTPAKAGMKATAERPLTAGREPRNTEKIRN